MCGKTRVLGGITVVDTLLVTRAMDYARGHSEPLADTQSSVNMRTAGVDWRAEPGDMETLDGRDDEKRADLIAERLRQWKSVTKV